MDGNVPTPSPDAGLVALLLKQLRVWSRNPRKTVGDLTELAASIKEHGIIEPLLVRPLPAPETVEQDGETVTLTHEILAGQRRYLGAILAGSDSAPCIVREMGDAEALEIGLVENGQRKDPSPLEEAEAMNVLIVEYGRTVEEIADKLGRDRRYVQRRLALLSLSETAKTWLREDALPLKHAEMLAAVDTATQEGVLTRYKTRDLPSAREFARVLSFELMSLDNAPFDTKDAKLVSRAGACGPCPKNSASQRDLFDGMGAGAHCLDRACWDAKVEALWERAVKDAKKRRLTVLDERELFAWGRVVRKDLPYVSAEERKDREAPQTAVARDPYGTIVPLYDRPMRDDDATRTDDDCDEDDHDQSADDIEPESDDRADAGGSPGDESTSARQDRQERTRARYSRLLDVLATPEGLRVALRMALGSVVVEWGGTDLWRCMDVLGLDYHEDSLPEADAARVPEGDVLRVLAAILVAGWLEDAPDEDTSAAERALRAMMEAPPRHMGQEVLAMREGLGITPDVLERIVEEMGGDVTEPVTGPAKVPPETSVIEPSPTAPATCVWIKEKVWDGLSEDDRDALTNPDVDYEVQWDGREGFVTARVPATRIEPVRAVAKARRVKITEGDAMPVKRSKKARS